MKTLTFTTRTDAEARSRAEWEKVLGRPKRPADVTEFLWPVQEDGAKVSLVIPDTDVARLSKTEAALAQPYAGDSTVR